MSAAHLPAKKYDAKGAHIGPGPWMDVIWAVNAARPETFGSPEVGPWWAGGSVEEYPTARVIHHTDETVTVAGKDDETQTLINNAVKELGL